MIHRDEDETMENPAESQCPTPTGESSQGQADHGIMPAEGSAEPEITTLAIRWWKITGVDADCWIRIGCPIAKDGPDLPATTIS